MTNILELLKHEKVAWKKLGEIGSIFSGLKGVTAEDFKTGTTKYIPYISVFNNYEINNDSRVETVRIKEIEKQNLVKLGDILFTASSENIKDAGMTAVVTEDLKEETYLNSFCFIYRFFENIEILPDFSKHLFRSIELRKKISNTAQGVTRFNISKDRILNIEIPIPSIETQQKIVEILDKFINYVTELQSELQSRTKQYEYYRDLLLSEEYLNKITKEMGANGKIDIVQLDDFSEYCDGVHQTPKYTVEGVPFVSVENIKDIYGTKKYISEEDYKKYKFIPEQGDIFMTRIGDIGTCSLVKDNRDLAYYVTLALIKLDKNYVDSSYIKLYIESRHGKKELNKRILHHATPIKVNLRDIGKLKFPIPPLHAQQHIVSILDKFDTLVNDIKEGLPKEIEQRQKQYEYWREQLLSFNR